MKFKLYSTVAIVLCICFLQICQSVDDQTKKEYLQYYLVSDLNSYLNGSNAIKDINPEFVEDVKFILEKLEDNLYGTGLILSMMDSIANLFDGKNSKITSATVKEQISKEKSEVKTELPLEIDMLCMISDRMIVFTSILLKELPAERVSGIINLQYGFYGGGMADKDLENALGYLYGTEARPLTLNPDIPLENSEECIKDNSGTIPKYMETIKEHLRSLNSSKINPEVLIDVEMIANRYPYSIDIYQMLEFVDRLLTNLNEKSSKTEICELINQKRPWFETFYNVKTAKFRAINHEGILRSRMFKESVADIMNLIRANWGIDGSDGKKALEYAYTPENFNAEWCNQNAATN